MVSLRCKMAVQSVLESSKIDYLSIKLGEVKLAADLTAEQKKILTTALQRYELELINDKRKIIVERIKTLIIETFHSSGIEMRLKFSAYLSQTLDYDYTYLANTFSEMEGGTIERFYISTRIERAKELIVYEGLSIKEIAHQLNYSSVAHLSYQFKKVTGESLSMFRKRCELPGFIWKNV